MNSREHLVQDYAHSPPICCHAVAFPSEDLRSKVGRSTSDSLRDLIVTKNLSHTKVNYFQISVLIEKQVLQLQVTVHNIAIVEIL